MPIRTANKQLVNKQKSKQQQKVPLATNGKQTISKNEQKSKLQKSAYTNGNQTISKQTKKTTNKKQLPIRKANKQLEDKKKTTKKCLYERQHTKQLVNKQTNKQNAVPLPVNTFTHRCTSSVVPVTRCADHALIIFPSNKSNHTGFSVKQQSEHNKIHQTSKRPIMTVHFLTAQMHSTGKINTFKMKKLAQVFSF